MRLQPLSPSPGSALIVCLSLIVLVTILLVGFVTTARLERGIASSHLAGQEAALFAKMGADVAAARVETATSGSDARWISTPGRVLVSSTDDAAASPKTVELFSGEIDSVQDDISVNLNPASLTQSTGLVMADPTVVLPQRWIYVWRDGVQKVATAVPAYDKANPVVGRYAFWTDDESARINWNTAWTRDAANPHNAAHPSRVELTAAAPISVGEATAIEQFRTASGFFNSPLEVKRVTDAPKAGEIAGTQPFSFTHYSHSPARNLFGEQRLVLTTRKDRAGADGAEFFDIVKTANKDPGLLSNLDNGKVQTLFGKLYGYLNRTDWPLLPGKSFVARYGAQNAAQIALNLIEYVRSADSTLTVVEPLRGTFTAASGTFTVDATATPNTILGNTRRPVLTEMAISVPDAAGQDADGSPAFLCRVFIEVYLPKEAGASIDLTSGYKLTINNIRTIAGAATEEAIAAGEVTGGAILAPGEYRTIVKTIPVKVSSLPSPLPPPTQFYLRAAISYKSPAIRLDVAPLATGAGNIIEYTAVPGTPDADLQSVAVDDPYVNRHKDDWKLGRNTFGSAPATPTSTLGTASAANPPQDTDSGGLIVATSVGVPAPGSAIRSAGEIGFIHSGIRGNPSGKGTPWRTLRLQPKTDGRDSLPDWALTDLFAAAQPAPENAAINPLPDSNGLPTATGGLINLNGTLYPFKDTDGRLLATRTLPLQALLQGANQGAVTGTLAQTLAKNILAQTPAAHGTFYGEAGTYSMPGEIAEVSGVADGGEASEGVVRDVIELEATRGNVFGVYCVGQSLRQSPSGTFRVLGEKRTLTLFERTDSGVKGVYEQDLGL